MDIGLIKETISLRKDLLQKDKEYTNELLVDDIIAYLGYNKRLDAGVNRRVSDDIDWEIIDEDKNIKMMVKVYSYGYTPNQEEISKIAQLGKDNKYKVCLITDGENIFILRPYNKLYGSIKINLFNDNERTTKILDALSKNNNDSSVVDYYYYKELMTSEVIEKTIESKKDSIAEDVLSELGCPVEEEFMASVIQAISQVYDKSVHNAETLELQKKISDTEIELAAAKDSIEVLTSKLEIVQGELQNKQSELDTKQAELDNKQTELEAKEKEVDSKQTELAEYIQNLNELREQNSKLQSDLEAEQITNSELNEKLSNLEESNVELNEDVDSDEELNNDTQARIDTLQAEKEALAKEREQLEIDKNNLKAELDKLNEETIRLNQVIDGLRASSQSITLSKEAVVPQNVVLVDSNIESLASEIVGKLRSNSGESSPNMDDELRKLQDYIYNLELSLSNSKRMVESLNSEKEVLLDEKAKLQRTLDETVIKLDETSRKYDDTLKELRLVRSDKEDLENQNKDLNKFLEQSRQRNEEILANGVSSDVSSGTDAIMANYRVQIEDLSTKLAIAEENVDHYKKEYETLKQQMEDLASNKSKRVEELLDCISDSEELNRTYVGVIQEELYQTETLNRFIGMSLQKLYELKTFEASNYIFNGDIFSLIQNGENRDLIINSKSYDIDISNIAEDEALNKLRVIFSKFTDIPFGCKKIGTLPVTSSEDVFIDNDDEQDIDYGTESYEGDYSDGSYVESDGYSEEYSDGQDNYQDTEYDANGEYEYSDENLDDYSADSDYNTEEYYGDNEEYPAEDNILYVTQFNEVDRLTELAELRLNAVRYMVSSDKTFIIARDYEEVTLEKMLSKSIDALLAMALSLGYYEVTKEFKELDLSSLGDEIIKVSDNSSDNVRVFGGQYEVHHVNNVYDIISIITEIAHKLKLDLQDVWLYLDGETESDDIIEGYGAYENSITVYDNSVYEVNNNYTKGFSIIPGYLPDIIPMTRNSMIAHNDILKNIMAVKSERIALAVKGKDDCVKVIKALFDTAINDGININLDNIGYIINDNRQIVYDNKDDVTSEYHEFECDDRVYYVPDMEVYQYIYSIIKVQAGLFFNKKIAIKTEVDLDAIDFYKSYFESCEPSLTLAISEFVSFLTDKDKK